MELFDTLHFVRGAVASRDVVPALTHFYIYGDRIQGTNGRITIDAALPSVMSDRPLALPAEKFTKAVDLLDGSPELTVKEDCVWLRSGRLRVKLPLIAQDAFPYNTADPAEWEPDDPILEALGTLRPFVASDANQIWPLGVWLDAGGHAYATNNVSVLRYPCTLLQGTERSINLPGATIDEMVSFGIEPEAFGVSDTSITFHYANGAWIKSLLIPVPWPLATLQRIYSGINFKRVPKVPEGLRLAVQQVMPFCENEKFPVIVFSADGVATEEGSSQAAVEGFKLPAAKYNGNMLALVLSCATHFQPIVDAPNPFKVGTAGEGVLSSLRQ